MCDRDSEQTFGSIKRNPIFGTKSWFLGQITLTVSKFGLFKYLKKYIFGKACSFLNTTTKAESW